MDFYDESSKSWERFFPKRKRRRRVLLFGAFLLLLSSLLYFFVLPKKPLPLSEGSQGSVSSPQAQSQETSYPMVEGEIRRKGTLSRALRERGLSPKWTEFIVSKLNPYINFRKIKEGRFKFSLDEKGDLYKFIYEASPTEIYEIEKEGNGYRAKPKEVPLKTKRVKIRGEIRSSLFEAMDAIGERDSLALSFAEILASEVDFYKDVREGDQFQLIVEKVYRDEVFIRYGQIDAVEFRQGEKVFRAIYFQGDYYDEKGLSLKKAFLKAPLRFTRISSNFSRARRHPILGGIFPHFGVDYAAPPGTPVWAVADGRVVACGWGGGFGKQVILKHPNGYIGYYGHLSRFGPGIRKGLQVKQKQIIGYVGSTGLSTGPHLDYRLAKDGKFVNPLKEVFPGGAPLPEEKREAFKKKKDEMILLLNGKGKTEETIKET